MEWGIGVIVVILLFVSYVIVQETRAQLHWRGLVEAGDVTAIRSLVEDEAEHWRSSRVPKGTSSLLWHGIQTVELLDVTPKGMRLSCNADGEYSLIGGKRVETSSPLNEGMKITQRLAEMAMYDIPNVKLDHVQIDVYTSFRDTGGVSETRCILSTRVNRATIEHIDWDATQPSEFIELNEGRFASDGTPGMRSVEPFYWEQYVPPEPEPDADEESARRNP